MMIGKIREQSSTKKNEACSKTLRTCLYFSKARQFLLFVRRQCKIILNIFGSYAK